MTVLFARVACLILQIEAYTNALYALSVIVALETPTYALVTGVIIKIIILNAR